MQFEFNISNLRPFEISNIIAHEFAKENPDKSNVELIAQSLLKEISKLKPESIEGRKILKIPEKAFPSVMKTWLKTHRSLNFEKLPINQDIEVKEAKAEQAAGVKQVKSYTYANQQWNDVELVLKAKSGVNGAWFFTSSQRGSVVVKAGSQEQLDIQLMGTTFLKFMGINVPDCRIVDRNSNEGVEISKLGKSKNLNEHNPSHYLVMDRISGLSYEDLSTDLETIEMVVNNLEDIGKLAIYDLVLGNFDRFQLNGDGLNAGNIMFQNNSMFAIDTDCIDQEKELTQLIFKRIINDQGDRYSEKIARNLALKLGVGVDVGMIPSEKILIGMKLALDNLVKINDDPSFRKKFIESYRDRRGMEESFPSHITHFLEYIKALKSSK